MIYHLLYVQCVVQKFPYWQDMLIHVGHVTKGFQSTLIFLIVEEYLDLSIIKKNKGDIMDKFFVYGTLKVGGHFSSKFDKLRKSAKPAFIENFDLYDLGSFPAVIRGEGEVKGELHSYEQPERVRESFDIIEGYFPGDNKNSLYLRKIARIKMEDGSYETGYVYIFNDKFLKYKGTKIKSGVWNI